MAESAGVVLELLVEPGVPLWLDQLLEDVADQPLLVGGEKITPHRGLGHVPVVAHPRPQQAKLLVDVVPGKADLLPLLGRERRVQTTREGLGRLGGDAAGHREEGRTAGRHGGAGGRRAEQPAAGEPGE